VPPPERRIVILDHGGSVPTRNDGEGISTRIMRAVKRTRTASVKLCGEEKSASLRPESLCHRPVEKKNHRAR